MTEQEITKHYEDNAAYFAWLGITLEEFKADLAETDRHEVDMLVKYNDRLEQYLLEKGITLDQYNAIDPEMQRIICAYPVKKVTIKQKEAAQ